MSNTNHDREFFLTKVKHLTSFSDLSDLSGLLIKLMLSDLSDLSDSYSHIRRLAFHL